MLSDSSDSLFHYILCINLDRHKERQLRIISTLSNLRISPDSYEFINACDCEDLKNNFPNLPQDFHLYKGWKIESENNYWNREMKLGEIGCSISHFKAWKRVVQLDKTTLVLEDDAYFIDDFKQRLELITKEMSMNKFDLLYLGRNDLSKEWKMITESVCVPSFSYRSHAYVITPELALKLIQSEFKRNLIPVDEFLPSLYCDHLRKDIRIFYPKHEDLKIYAAQPNIILQLEDVDKTNELAQSTIEFTEEYF